MFHTVTLEVSLKPFKQTDSAYIKKTVAQIYDQWRPLLKNRKTIQFMLWAADGSEILDYKGNLDDTFNWCIFVGDADNPLLDPTGTREIMTYIDNPPKMTYRILKEIVSEFKSQGAALYPDATINVGETFDIGGEFAVSDFKYRRHIESCTSKFVGKERFLNSHAILNGDDYPYAGFPNGLPDKTPFGILLGRQTNIFFRDLGFDFLWLSNGVGFSMYPWGTNGVIFDGEKYDMEQLDYTRDELFRFWKYFRQECPDYPLAVRGTNYSVGIDYASDAVPLYDIYNAGLNTLPPPNSPWASINQNFGIELMSHMSRICELPGDDFMFRYYLHDPWFVNSPWYDRYEGQPHDIYMPMAISRIDENESTKSASLFNILSIDNTFGNMPDCCVNEPIPHILKAEKDAADEPAPFVWVYPFREYTSAQEEKKLRQMMHGDGFIAEAINNGFPLSSVVSCDNFLRHNKDLYRRSVLITPVPEADSEFEANIISYVNEGGKVIFYGALNCASETFCNTFSLSKKEGVCGKIPLSKSYYPDIHKDGRIPEYMLVRAENSDGDINTVSSNNTAIMTTENGYTLAAKHKNSVWYRAPIGGTGHGYITSDLPSESARGEILFRTILKEFDYTIKYSKVDADTKTPLLILNRSDNAHIFSVYSPNTTIETRLKFPLGAPILNGYDTELKDGAATYRFPRSDHRECRVFVEQESGIVTSKEEIAEINKTNKRRIVVKGLKNATVRFFGETACADKITAHLNPSSTYSTDSDSFEWEIINSPEYGIYFEARNVTGELRFSMPRV